MTSDPGTPRPAATVLNIQHLRGLAALMVVFHHARNPAPWLFSPLGGFEAGAHGVDIFFVISGFIMYAAARTEPAGEFVRRRIIRVAPLYWLATLAFVAASGAWGTPDAAPADLVRSALFVPFPNAAHQGQVWPVLVPGWTLNYEMFFYALFALGLVLRRPAAVAGVTICALVAAGLATHPAGAAAATYSNPRLLEFAAGLVLGAAYGRWPLRWMGWLLAPALAALVLAQWAGPAQPLALFAGAVGTVGAALGLEGTLRGAWTRGLKLLGDASYSLYLSHMVTLIYARRAFKHLPLDGWPQFAGFILFALASSTAVAVAVHLWVEKPMIAWLNRATRRPLAGLAAPRRAQS
jgi:exopolysaccharide production protein ExoZ